MTVQELFKGARTEEIIDAYFLMHTIFYPYEKHTIQQKLAATEKIKKAIEETSRRFRGCAAAEAESPMTIFVLEQLAEDYDSKGQPEVYLFAIIDREAEEKSGDEFRLWDVEDDRGLQHYGIDMTELTELAGYRVAGDSVWKLGEAACCAEILYEFFEFGYTDERRKENIDFLLKSLEEAEKEIAEGRCYPAEEVFEEIERDILESCQDEDEKTYMFLQREFEKSTEEITRRYTDKILHENRKQMAEAIKRSALGNSVANRQEGGVFQK